MIHYKAKVLLFFNLAIQKIILINQLQVREFNINKHLQWFTIFQSQRKLHIIITLNGDNLKLSIKIFIRKPIKKKDNLKFDNIFIDGTSYKKEYVNHPLA